MAQVIREALTFDDVLLEPGYSNVLPADVDIQSKFSRNIKLNIPIVSAAMDTVTEHEMAIAMAEAGGIGVIHKNLTHDQQAAEVSKVKRYVSGMVVNPVTIQPQEKLVTVRELMQQHDVSGIPVVEGETNRLIGIVTYRDVRFAKDPNTLVEQLMTSENLVTVTGNVSQDEARDLLHKHRIEKLIVVDENYSCVGLITFRDIDRAQATPLALKDPHGRLMVAAAVGVSLQEFIRAQCLVNAGADALVVDTAHGHTQGVGDQVKRLKAAYPNLDVVAGNVATPQAAQYLYDSQADGIKVGIGPGCFVPGMPVVTHQGSKPIEKVQIGDRVLTHKGQWKPVTNLFTFYDKKQIIHINDIICTPNHEFFVLHKKYQTLVTDDNIHEYAEWIEAKNLTKDYLLIQHNRFPKYKLVEIDTLTEESYDGVTHDLEVADDHSYNINGVIVHNSICTTRVVAGIGIPQFSAILETAEMCENIKLPLIADGGIRSSGDIVKALAAGAHSVMLGSMLAGTDESPGETFIYQGRTYKSYRGMGSLSAMNQGSADRYSQAGIKLNKMVPEGVEARVPARGPLGLVLHQLVGGLRSGMGYVGAKDLLNLQARALFRRITNAGLKESIVHDVAITKEAPNYNHNS